jgi:hypothetical protein
VVEYIQSNYAIPEQRIFVFETEVIPGKLYCTYNAVRTNYRTQNTINIHRKKQSNTLYSVNALNAVIRAENGGIVDKTYPINWMKFENSLILTDKNSYEVIPLTFHKKIAW